MNEFFPIKPSEFFSLSTEFTRLRDDFVTIFFANADGSKSLAVTLTEAQAAYYKLIQIGSASYPDDKACMNAILNGLTAREYVLANLILQKRGTHDD